MKHTVIGTAGHIDHGKTLLLKAMTGVDADRLPEEQARGMTIDLGFVFLGRDVTIIDVPGHEKFIKNMLAGVSTIDLVILVIAADDGIMPQTREHFEILQLLDIKRGMIALTKIDLVDEEWLELVKDEIGEFVKGTFLEDAPVMPVSGITRQGIPEIKEMLEKMIDETPSKSDKGVFRMWTDRVFVLKGIGTIVAGTVLSGTLRAGEKLELLPQVKDVRARKIQVHNEEVSKCTVGERAAVNITGVEVSEIERGNLLAIPGNFSAGYMFNAKLYLLKSASKQLMNRTRIRFHAGTAELLGRIMLLEKKVLNPGESTVVQFRLESPIALDIGDRFIIRSYSPAHTIGGGKILEINPRKLKYLPEGEAEKLEKLEEADPEQIFLHVLANNPLEMKTVDKLAAEVSVKQEVIKEIIEKLLKMGIVSEVTRKPNLNIVLAAHMADAREKVLEFLKNFHKQFPFLSGVKMSEVKAKLFGKINHQVFEAVINPLISEDKVILKDETVCLSAHKISFTPEQEKIREKIETVYLEKRYVTPSFDELADIFRNVKRKELQNIVTGMVETGMLIEIKTNVEKPVLFHGRHIMDAKKLLVDYLAKNGEIRLTEFRQMIDSTRKFTTPILIYFDRNGITERDEDIRRLKEPL